MNILVRAQINIFILILKDMGKESDSASVMSCPSNLRDCIVAFVFLHALNGEAERHVDLSLRSTSRKDMPPTEPASLNVQGSARLD